MAIQVKLKANKHFQYQKKMRAPGDVFSTSTEDAEALVSNGKADFVKEGKDSKKAEPEAK